MQPHGHLHPRAGRVTGGVASPDDGPAPGTIIAAAGSGTAGYAGDGGFAVDAELNNPQAVGRDGSDNIYIADFFNSAIRKFTPGGTITTAAHTGNAQLGIDTSPAEQLTVGTDGSIYYESAFNLIRVSSGGGSESYVCQCVYEEAQGVLVDASGDVYAALSGAVVEFRTDGSTAVYSPDIFVTAIAFDGAGDLLMAGEPYNNTWKIEIMNTSGQVSTVFGANNLPPITGMAVDSLGNVFISEGNPFNLMNFSGTVNQEVVEITTSGAPVIVAGNAIAGNTGDGGQGVGASLNQPMGLALDSAGDLFIADDGNNRVREVVQAGAPAPALPTHGPTFPPTYVPPLDPGAPSPIETQGGGSDSEVCLCAQGQAGAPVDTATGEFWHKFTDLSVSGRGMPLTLTRTYSSNAASQDSALGFGWSSSYLMHVTADGEGNLFVHQENGAQAVFVPNGSGGYAPAEPRILASLVQNSDGTYVFTRRARSAFTFDATGRLTRERDLNGYMTTLSYDSNGDLGTITDSAGRQLHVTTTSGRITQVSDPAGHAVSYGYDAVGELTSVTDVAGDTWTFTYDSAHRLTTMLNPNQQGAASPQPLTNVYDGSGRVTSQTDYAGRTTSFDYSGIPGATLVTDPRGDKTVDRYTNGLLQSQTRGYATTSAATSTFGYDPNTFATTSVVDPDGKSWTYTYDSAGNRTSAADPLGHAQTWTYDALNDPTSATDASGVTTTMSYDVAGNLLSVSTPISTGGTATTTLHYGDAGHPGDVTSVTDPNGKVSRATYNGDGDRVSVTDADGNTSISTYNNVGWLFSAVSPRGNVAGANPADYTTTFSRDALGRVTQVTDPLGHHAQRSYDADGNVAAVTDGNGNHTAYSYNADDQLLATMRADLTTVSNGYDAAGNLTSQTDGAGAVTAYAYDALNRVSSMTDPDHRGTSYGYDAAGHLTSVTDPDGRATTIGYDAAGRRTSVTYSDTGTHGVSYGYDADSHRISMIDGTGATTYSYDSLGRLTSTTDSAGDAVGYGYDANGQATALSYPNGKTLTRGFDDAGQLTSVTDWNGSTTRFGYDADGNLTGITYPNGVTEATTLNTADQITAMSDTLGASTLASYGYGRDPQGQVTSTTPTGATGQTNETYGYSALNQLTADNTASHNGSYGYDTADNLTSMPNGTAQTFDASNQLQTSSGPSGAATFGYNNEGDRTSATSSAGTASYGYNQANELTGYTSPTGSVHAGYGYNGDGLRMTKTVNGNSSNFSWDPVTSSVPLLLSDGTTSYVYGPGGLLVEQLKPAPTISYVTSAQANDTLGTAKSLTVTFPTAAAAGDQMLLAVSYIQGQAPVAPVGYHWVDVRSATDAPSETIAVFAHTATGGESSATVTFGQPITKTHAKTLLGVIYRGVDPVTPIDGTNSAGTGPLATSVTVPSISVSHAHDQLVLFAGATDNLLPTSWTVGTMTARMQSSGQPLTSAVAADQAIPSSGATGSRVATSSTNAELEGMLVALRPSSGVEFIQHDQQASTRLITDTAGDVTGTYTYDPYGNITSHAGSSTVLLYDSQYQDSETGLYYLRTRYLDSRTGQFVSRDTELVSTRAAYSFAQSNPLNFADLTGAAPCNIGDGDVESPDGLVLSCQDLTPDPQDPLREIRFSIFASSAPHGECYGVWDVWTSDPAFDPEPRGMGASSAMYGPAYAEASTPHPLEIRATLRVYDLRTERLLATYAGDWTVIVTPHVEEIP